MPEHKLAFPAGIMFLAGIALVLFALHGLDEKHSLLGNKLAPKANANT